MHTILLSIAVIAVTVAALMSWIAWRLWREERLRSDVRVALLEEMCRPERGPAVPLASALFQAEPEHRAWPRRLGIAAGIFAAAALGVVAFGALERPATQHPDMLAVAPPPLELLSLGHTQEPGMLVVTGLVQNPRASTARTRVVATAVLLDGSGSMIGDGRAPLDVARLEPGDESPFVIRIPAASSVARYRVSFRGGDDRPLPHVDRRDSNLARKEAP